MALVLFIVVLHRGNSFNLCHDGDMMYEMRWKKTEPTLLSTQGIFNLPNHTGMIGEELAFNVAVSYIQQENGLQHS